jgi:hypothetical protein
MSISGWAVREMDMERDRAEESTNMRQTLFLTSTMVRLRSLGDVRRRRRERKKPVCSRKPDEEMRLWRRNVVILEWR